MVAKKHTFVVSSLVFSSLLAGCFAVPEESSPVELESTEEPLSIGVGMSGSEIRAESIGAFSLGAETPVGRTIFSASRLWMRRQDKDYALAKNCANNVSIVIRSALRARGIVAASSRMKYESESVYSLVRSIRNTSL